MIVAPVIAIESSSLSNSVINAKKQMKNRFKGVGLIDKVLKELWTEVCDIVQEVVIKTIPKKKKCKKANWLSEEALQMAD